MRRMTGAIFTEMRPERMIMSACLGDARVTSAPKRDRSVRGPASVVIISHAQQHHEDDDRPEGEAPEGVQPDRHRIEKDDLDVEQDEEHRDQIEADPEPEALGDLGGESALVRLLLHAARTVRAEHSVEEREGQPDGAAQQQEDETWYVAVEQ